MAKDKLTQDDLTALLDEASEEVTQDVRASRKTTKSKSDLVEKRLSRKLASCKLPPALEKQLSFDSTGQITHAGFLQRSHVFRILRKILSPSEFVLMDYLYDEAWDGKKTGQARISLSMTASMTCLSLTTIKLGMKELAALGLIRVIHVSFKKGSLISVPFFTGSKSKSDQVEIRLGQNSTRSWSENDQVASRNPTTSKEQELILNKQKASDKKDQKLDPKFNELTGDPDITKWLKNPGAILGDMPKSD